MHASRKKNNGSEETIVDKKISKNKGDPMVVKE
jgi:hypothetical protein